MNSVRRPCPVCHRLESYRPVSPRGFWEEKVLSLVGLRPYRCSSCGRRALFSHRGAEAPRPIPPKAEAGSWGQLDSPSQFLPSEDDRDFKDLICEIRQAEKRMEGDGE